MSSDKLFYDQHIFCCTNERPPEAPRGSCKAKGSVELRNYMNARVKEEGLKDGRRINAAGCLDRCELGPVMVVYPEGTWYTYGTKADVDEIIEKHLKNGEIVERLRLDPDQKELRDEQKQGRLPTTATC